MRSFNDRFIGCVDFQIFDRWGELIFESRNSQVGWDGTYNNQIAQEGVYTWRIQFKLLEGDDRREIFGKVLSIR